MQEPYNTDIRGATPSTWFTYRNPLLLSNLASDVHTSPQADWPEEVGEATQNAAVSNCLCILANDVARAEINDNA